MALELWATIAQVATFLVIAATAIAALVQLRHMPAANQVAALQTFTQTYEGQEFRDAFHFVCSELKGPWKIHRFAANCAGATSTA